MIYGLQGQAARGTLSYAFYSVALAGFFANNPSRVANRGKGQMRSMSTLTRADLAEAINRRMGLSRAESLGMVEAILRHMCEPLAHGDNVKISGFGTFLLRDKTERVGRNPKTGVEVPITPRRVLTFRASQMLKDRIAE